jgi:hypothetical protein
VSIYDVDSHNELAHRNFELPKDGGPLLQISPEGDLVGIRNKILRLDTLLPACPDTKQAFQFLGGGQILESSPFKRDWTLRECATGTELRTLRIF